MLSKPETYTHNGEHKYFLTYGNINRERLSSTTINNVLQLVMIRFRIEDLIHLHYEVDRFSYLTYNKFDFMKQYHLFIVDFAHDHPSFTYLD